MSNCDDSSPELPHDPSKINADPNALPPHDVLAHAFNSVGMIVAHLGPNGVVLHTNPETQRVTGYSEEELVGRNFWGTLFPGRLFNQVPRFISAVHPASALVRDFPMTIRTKDGKERVIAWTRHPLPTPKLAPGEKPPLNVGIVLVMGQDLTDRLSDADLPLEFPVAKKEAPQRRHDDELLEEDFVTPLAITPPLPEAMNSQAAIKQTHEILDTIQEKLNALDDAGRKFMDTDRALVTANLHQFARQGPAWKPVNAALEKFHSDMAKANRTDARDLGSGILAMLMVCRSTDQSKSTEG